MSIWTSVWFWVLVLGIILTIVGVVIWIVTGNANITVGLLLGVGVGWIIGGLIFWIFGRSGKPKEEKPKTPTQSSPIASSTKEIPPMGNTNNSMNATNPYLNSNPGANTYMGNANLSQQQQLLQLLQSNPQLLNNYSSGQVPKI